MGRAPGGACTAGRDRRMRRSLGGAHARPRAVIDLARVALDGAAGLADRVARLALQLFAGAAGLGSGPACGLTGLALAPALDLLGLAFHTLHPVTHVLLLS